MHELPPRVPHWLRSNRMNLLTCYLPRNPLGLPVCILPVLLAYEMALLEPPAQAPFLTLKPIRHRLGLLSRHAHSRTVPVGPPAPPETQATAYLSSLVRDRAGLPFLVDLTVLMVMHLPLGPEDT